MILRAAQNSRRSRIDLQKGILNTQTPLGALRVSEPQTIVRNQRQKVQKLPMSLFRATRLQIPLLLEKSKRFNKSLIKWVSSLMMKIRARSGPLFLSQLWSRRAKPKLRSRRKTLWHTRKKMQNKTVNWIMNKTIFLRLCLMSLKERHTVWKKFQLRI